MLICRIYVWISKTMRTYDILVIFHRPYLMILDHLARLNDISTFRKCNSLLMCTCIYIVAREKPNMNSLQYLQFAHLRVRKCTAEGEPRMRKAIATLRN